MKAYDRSDRKVSIHPANLLYYHPAAPGANQDHHLGCCLFGFTSGDTLNSYSHEHFPNHIRTDVLLNADCFVELTLEIAELLTGAIYTPTRRSG